MKDSSSVHEYYNLWWLLSQARYMVYRAREKELAQYKISPEYAGALYVIQALGNNTTPAEISRWLSRETHTVSGLVSRMERKGLVRKTKDLDRKNLIRISVTDKGRQVYNESVKAGSIFRIMSSLSKAKRHRLESYLETLRAEAMKELAMAYRPPFPPANQ